MGTNQKKKNGKTLDYFSNKYRRHRYTYPEFLQLPIITIVFANNVRLEILPHNYMENVPLRHVVLPHHGNENTTSNDEGAAVVVVQPWNTTTSTSTTTTTKATTNDNTLLLINRIYFEEGSSSSSSENTGDSGTTTGGCVLGANAMVGYDILFDAQDHQIGITKTNCYL